MSADYHFTTFWAPHDEPAARTYHTAHQRALRRFGTGPLASTDPSWFHNPHVLVVLALTPAGVPAGGVRLHRAAPHRPLPLAVALAPAHPAIHGVLAPALARGAAESCGLWVAAEHSGRGLALLLTRYSVALAARLGLELLTLSAPHSLAMTQRLGFAPVRAFGNQGRVLYPTPAYVSTLMAWGGADNPAEVSAADPYQRVRICSLRDQPAQLCREPTGAADLWVRYAIGAAFDELLAQPTWAQAA